MTPGTVDALLLALCVGAALALLVVAVRHVALRRRLHRLVADLADGAGGDGAWRRPVTVSLGDRDVDALAAEINVLVLEARASRARAERGEEEFRRLIADVSHDLRTPLTAIRGFQQLLAAGELRPEQRERLAIAHRHAEDLSALVDRLFEYTYLVGGASANPAGEVREVDFVRLVTDVLLGQADPLTEAGLTPRVTGEPTLPLRVDVEALTRIVGNLVRNAWQHGTGELEIEVRGEAGPGGAAVLTVRNDLPAGARVDPEGIFERFATADSARSSEHTARGARRRGGSGLGLAIVAALVARLGGTVGARLEDAPDPAEAGPRCADGGVSVADDTMAGRVLAVEVRVPRTPAP